MSRKTQIIKKFWSLALVICLLLNVFSVLPAYAEGDQIIEEAKGQITLSLETFTLGRGYLKEATNIPFYEGDKLSKLVTEFLGENQYKNGGTIEDGFYITKIRDEYKGEVSIPKFIKDNAGEITENQDTEWLGEGNYTAESGWTYIVNNESPSVGMSDFNLKDGDVVRIQYSVHGYGKDIGFGWEGNYVEQANKDALTAKIAEINSDPYKMEILSNEDVKLAYQNAYKLLSNIESSQESIDNAFKTLKETLRTKYKDESTISSWAYEEIKQATEKGFVSGYDGDFRPKRDITRAEFTKIIVSMLGLELADTESYNFKDIKTTDWFYTYAITANKAGIIKGNEGNFRPNDNITREEMAAIVVRALNLNYEKSEINIKDMNKVSAWAKKDVETVLATGLMKGDGENFAPKSKANREMATVIAMRAFNHK